MNWKKFFSAAAIRCLRTFAQAALSYIGTAALLSEVNWWGVLSAGCMGAILSLLMAFATGLPEVDKLPGGEEK